MTTVGAYEAKTHLSRLLDRVAKGESITITKHGRPVAVMQPVGERSLPPVDSVVDELRAFRRGRRLDGLDLREMIEEGRR
jgi:prevent-host-death family protein